MHEVLTCERAQRARLNRGVRDVVRHQNIPAVDILEMTDGAISHARMLRDDVTDLAQPNPMPPHLDLVVVAPQVFDRSVGEGLREIAAAVQRGARLERIIDKPFVRESPIAEISCCQAGAADVKLADDLRRDGFPPIIEQKDSRIRRWTPDRHRSAPVALRIVPVNHAAHGRLGRAVLVEDRDTATKLLVDAARERCVQILSAHDERAEAGRRRGLFGDEGEMARRELDDVNAIFAQHVHDWRRPARRST